MITNLHIKNLGIISEIEMSLCDKFNVLTGETGAGKTLIIDSLSLISGGRFSKEMIRKGETTLYVEANLFLENEINDEEKNVVVSREISINGKNISKINGKLVSVSELKEFMEGKIDIHSQNDNGKLLDKKNHIEFVDSYLPEILNIKSEYKKLYSGYLKVNEELNSNLGDDRERKRMQDLLEYELNEIHEAVLIETEDELEQKRKFIQNSEKIINNVNIVKNELEENALVSLENVIKSLSRISDFNNEYEKKLKVVQNSYYDLKDIAYSSQEILENLEFNEEETNKFLERLDKINALKRKYGNTISDILEYSKNIKEKIDKINNMEDYIDNLKRQKEEIKIQLLKISKILNDKRVMVAEELSKKINHELLDMEMKNAEIKINIDYSTDKSLGINGQDDIEFLIKTNIGEDFLPLIKIASGGEMSRVMLAIKTVLSTSYKINTLVFDEIDTGISGSAASKVAKKIEKISNNTQILCVTHLPNIAALADNNLYIYKETIDGKTLTKIKTLEKEEKLYEVARISFGKINDAAINYALELQKEKQNV